MKTNELVKRIVLCLLFLSWGLGFFCWSRIFQSWEIKKQLMWISPLFLEINFVLILIGIAANIKSFQHIFLSLKRKSRVFLFLIVAAGILMAMFMAPRTHRIFYDEDIYMNVAQNIACLNRAAMCNDGGQRYGEYYCNQLEYNKEPSGWPYLLSLVMRLAGTSHGWSFFLTNMIWGLSVLAVFFIGFLLFENEAAGLFGALIMALIPEGLRWSNTTAAEPAAALFAGLALLSVLYAIKYPGNHSLFLAAVVIPFSLQFRGESGLVLLPLAVMLLCMSPGMFKQRRTYSFILLVLILTTAHLVQLYAVRGEAWGAPDGVKFALGYAKTNLPVNTLFYIENREFPLLFSLLFVCGLAWPARRFGAMGETRGFDFKWREKTVLLSWFAAFWGIFIFFYAGSYHYGADIRFSLMSYMPIAAAAGFGAWAGSDWIKDKFDFSQAAAVAAAIIIFHFLLFVPGIKAVGQEAWAARMDHHYAEIMAEQVPDDAVILTHNPNMFLLWGKNAAQGSILANNPDMFQHLLRRYPGGVFFHYNFWCNVSDPVQKAFCNQVLDMFNCVEVEAFHARDYKYALYRVVQGIE